MHYLRKLLLKGKACFKFSKQINFIFASTQLYIGSEELIFKLKFMFKLEGIKLCLCLSVYIFAEENSLFKIVGDVFSEYHL